MRLYPRAAYLLKLQHPSLRHSAGHEDCAPHFPFASILPRAFIGRILTAGRLVICRTSDRNTRREEAMQVSCTWAKPIIAIAAVWIGDCLTIGAASAQTSAPQSVAVSN